MALPRPAPSAVIICILRSLSCTTLLLASSASSFSPLFPSSSPSAASALGRRRRSSRGAPFSPPPDDYDYDYDRRRRRRASSIALLPPPSMGTTASSSSSSSSSSDDDDDGRVGDGIDVLSSNSSGGAPSSSSSSSSLSDNARRAYRDATILVTGASRGLGRSIALALSTCEPSLLILSGRDVVALVGVGEECERRMTTTTTTTTTGSSSSSSSSSGRRKRVEVVTCDLADGDSVDRLAMESLRLASERGGGGRRRRDPSSSSSSSSNGDDVGGGVVDVLINNGGVSSRSSFLETNIDVDEKIMRINFLSGARLAKRLVPAMMVDGGRVIWISSVQGKLGTPYRTSYAASKFAVQGYCESLRSELASSGVSVHVVSPGYVRTDLSLSAMTGDGRNYGKMDENTANGADPDEVAISILESVAAGKSDIVIAATFSARVAMWLKFLVPSILDRILAKRFEKQRVAMKKNE